MNKTETRVLAVCVMECNISPHDKLSRNFHCNMLPHDVTLNTLFVLFTTKIETLCFFAGHYHTCIYTLHYIFCYH